MFCRFEEAENDCTEALNLDDRYVKAYSRRATARKELGNFKASMEGQIILILVYIFFQADFSMFISLTVVEVCLMKLQS